MDKIWTTINNSDERKKREEKKRKDLLAIFTPPPDPRQLSHPIFHSHNSEDSRRAIPSGTPSLKTEERERKTVEGRKGPFEKSSLVTRSSCAAEKRFSLVLHSPWPAEGGGRSSIGVDLDSKTWRNGGMIGAGVGKSVRPRGMEEAPLASRQRAKSN